MDGVDLVCIAGDGACCNEERRNVLDQRVEEEHGVVWLPRRDALGCIRGCADAAGVLDVCWIGGRMQTNESPVIH